ncbi:Juvenile hormone acid O-methyltransferase [Eumeta japonica]|uniref:Juvenile hormone acid O-methyltransferase n=1 Tax=Eumeta variegata TaxID=151549 RepID=A0A4C1YXH5_EUMVA|nr:Juvenile hormone acid O-methyltransferase [Eumeta japonica]
MRTYWKEYNDRVLDVGCGDGGVTVDLLRQHMPVNFERLLGCDISESMIEHANKHYRDRRTEFLVLDIESSMPDELIEKFNHVFSFFTLHWVLQQEKAFRNIYNLLDIDGDCLLVFMGHTLIFDTWRRLSKQQKCSAYMKDVDKYVSPYHDCVDPETRVRSLMETVGFHEVDVQCRNKTFIYDNVESFKKALTAISPFAMPSNVQEEFLEEMIKELQLMDKPNDDIEDDTKVHSLLITFTPPKALASLRDVPARTLRPFILCLVHAEGCLILFGISLALLVRDLDKAVHVDDNRLDGIKPAVM